MIECEELPGLPPYGDLAKAFPSSWARTGREGYVVEIRPNKGATWVGNFRPGFSGFSGTYRHPNGCDVLVVSGGQGYVVDPEMQALRGEIGAGSREHGFWEVACRCYCSIWVFSLNFSVHVERCGTRVGCRGTASRALD